MNFFKITTFLITSSVLLCSTPEEFQQCPANEKLEKLVEKLSKQIFKNQKIMENLVSALAAERAEKEFLKRIKLEQLEEQQRQNQELINWFENQPWYARYSEKIAVFLIPWVTDELLPRVKSIITQMIAQKVVHGILSSTDFACGDVPEKLFPNRFGTTIAFRPGEWLQDNPDEREIKKAFRKLRREDPKFKEQEKTLTKLNQENLPFHIQNITEENLSKAKLEKELREDKKSGNTRRWTESYSFSSETVRKITEIIATDMQASAQKKNSSSVEPAD